MGYQNKFEQKKLNVYNYQDIMVQNSKLIVFCLFTCFILISTKITSPTNTLSKDIPQSGQAQAHHKILDPKQSDNIFQQYDQIEASEEQIAYINKRILQKETQSMQNKQQEKDGEKTGEKKKRRVFDCIMYMGESHMLKLRFLVMNSFVDYFIISEGSYTQTGQKKDLVFDLGQFHQYAHKILYIPVQNFPNVGNLTLEQKWQNNHFGRNSAGRMLKKYAKDDDIILIGDLDEILSREGFQKFNPEIHPWVATELIVSYYYFNRKSVYDYGGKIQIPHIQTLGTKITTYKVVRDRFKNELIPLKRGNGCETNPKNFLGYNPIVNCRCPIIRHAGWHLTYIMDDASLLKKVRSFADGRTDQKIQNFTIQRTRNPARQHYLIDFNVEDADLPIELKNDVLINKQKSIFYQYFVEVVPNQGCQDDEVEKSTGKRVPKSRIVYNLNEAKSRNVKNPYQCVKAPILQKEDESNQQILQKQNKLNQQKELSVHSQDIEVLKKKQTSSQTISKQSELQSQINQDSQKKGFFNSIFLTLYFYFSIIGVIVWLFSRNSTNGEKKQQEKQFDEDKVINSQRDGLKMDENQNISIA